MNEHERLVVLERDVAHIDRTLTDVKTDMKALRSEIHSNFRWLLGVFGGGVIFLATFIYFVSPQNPNSAVRMPAANAAAAPQTGK